MNLKVSEAIKEAENFLKTKSVSKPRLDCEVLMESLLGFNQAELLAEVVAKYHELPVIKAIKRTKNTKANFDLPRDERLTNVAEAFEISQEGQVENKRILLLDDIYTTGATIAECCKILKTGGAKRVEIVTLSRAMLE